jgi:hypothetical protein
MGSGTTLKASTKLGRPSIGMDIYPNAIDICKTGLALLGIEASVKEIGEDDESRTKKIKMEMKRKQDEGKIEDLTWDEYQDFVIGMAGGESNSRKTADGGVDGWIKDALVSVKHWKAKIGSPAVRDLIGAMSGSEYTEGIIIGREFSKEAVKECEKQAKVGMMVSLWTESKAISGGYVSKSNGLDFEIEIEEDENIILVVKNANQKVINYAWWINKYYKDPFFEDNIIEGDPYKARDSIGRIVLSEIKDLKDGSVITCMASSHIRGKTKEKSYRFDSKMRMIHECKHEEELIK